LYENRNGKVSTFSGGMRRRLSLAISLIGEPKLVILDEPTTGMDAKIRLQTWKLILKIKANRTVLITTHNMEEAECLSDTIIIMSKGRLIVEGSSVELKKKYGQGYLIKGYHKDTKEEITIKCS
jgi:ABC-type multidrug transport system ATPase subunit